MKVALAFAACAVLVLGLMLLRARVPAHTTYTYNGVTWTDHECYIDDDGTLWCGWEQT